MHYHLGLFLGDALMPVRTSHSVDTKEEPPTGIRKFHVGGH